MRGSTMPDPTATIHDDEAGVLCDCNYCTDLMRSRCEDAPCCGCCDGGLL